MQGAVVVVDMQFLVLLLVREEMVAVQMEHNRDNQVVLQLTQVAVVVAVALVLMVVLEVQA